VVAEIGRGCVDDLLGWHVDPFAGHATGVDRGPLDVGGHAELALVDFLIVVAQCDQIESARSPSTSSSDRSHSAGAPSIVPEQVSIGAGRPPARNRGRGPSIETTVHRPLWVPGTEAKGLASPTGIAAIAARSSSR